MLRVGARHRVGGVGGAAGDDCLPREPSPARYVSIIQCTVNCINNIITCIFNCGTHAGALPDREPNFDRRRGVRGRPPPPSLAPSIASRPSSPLPPPTPALAVPTLIVPPHRRQLGAAPCSIDDKKVMLFSKAAELGTPRGVHDPQPRPVNHRPANVPRPPISGGSSPPPPPPPSPSPSAGSRSWLDDQRPIDRGAGTSSKKRHRAWQGLGNLKSQDHKNSHKITNETTFRVSLCISSRPRQGGTQSFGLSSYVHLR